MTACDVHVAGSGLAGLTAGLFAARHGRSTVVLGAVPGGQLLSVTRVEDFPGFIEGVAGYDLCPIVHDQAMAAGAAFEMTELERLEETDDGWAATTADGRTISAKAVVVATGTEPGVLDSGLFVCAGGVAAPRFLDGLAVTDEHGHVETDAAIRTALPGLFAAGAIRSNFSGQAVTAAGDGAAAAVAAHWYLEAAGVPARAGGRPRRQPEHTLDPKHSVGDELLSRPNPQ